jgi:hypothetical protein
VAREEGWRIIRFERLRRRLFVAVGAVAAVLLGTGAGAALQRRRQPPPQRLRRAVVRR